jgi:hypothetical protein
MLLVPEEEEKQLPAEPPIHTEVLPMVDDLDSHHTEVGRVVVAVVVPRLVVVAVVAVVVPRLALVLVDTHTDPAGLHMHEEEEDTADGMAVAGILPPVDSLRHRHRHHSNILEVAAEADNGT